PPRLAVAAEALCTVEVRQPVALQALHDRRRQLPGPVSDVADQDAKAIAVEVPRLELVAVPADAEDADAVAFEVVEARLDRCRHRHHLPRDGVPALQPRGADIADGNAEPPRDLAREILRAHAALLDPQVQELARAARLIRGDFLDLEIVVHRLDAPA